MLAVSDSQDTVLFELDDSVLALELTRQLREDWPVYLMGQGDARFVVVTLDPYDVSMEMLLQRVAEWAGETGLRFVRFHVGDETAVVVAKEPDEPNWQS